MMPASPLRGDWVWKRRDEDSTTKRTKDTKTPSASLHRRFAFGVVDFTPRRQDAKGGFLFGAERQFRCLNGACGAEEAQYLGDLASWRGSLGVFIAPASIVGQSVFVFLVRLVVNSLFPNVNAHGGRAAP